MKLIACLATVAFGQTIDRNHKITDHSGYEVPFTRNREMPINLKNLLHRISRTKPRYDSSVNNLIQKVSEGAAESYAMMLSGESPLSDTNTRNSRSNADKSAIRSVGGSLNYVDLEMQRLGFQTEYHHYSDTYPPNLIATLPGTSKPDEIVVRWAGMRNLNHCRFL